MKIHVFPLYLDIYHAALQTEKLRQEASAAAAGETDREVELLARVAALEEEVEAGNAEKELLLKEIQVGSDDLH